jgi:hypothetical protein
VVSIWGSDKGKIIHAQYIQVIVTELVDLNEFKKQSKDSIDQGLYTFGFIGRLPSCSASALSLAVSSC